MKSHVKCFGLLEWLNREIFEHTRTLDTTRPITVVLFTNYATDKAVSLTKLVLKY